MLNLDTINHICTFLSITDTAAFSVTCKLVDESLIKRNHPVKQKIMSNFPISLVPESKDRFLAIRKFMSAPSKINRDTTKFLNTIPTSNSSFRVVLYETTIYLIPYLEHNRVIVYPDTTFRNDLNVQYIFSNSRYVILDEQHCTQSGITTVNVVDLKTNTICDQPLKNKALSIIGYNPKSGLVQDKSGEVIYNSRYKQSVHSSYGHMIAYGEGLHMKEHDSKILFCKSSETYSDIWYATTDLKSPFNANLLRVRDSYPMNRFKIDPDGFGQYRLHSYNTDYAVVESVSTKKIYVASLFLHDTKHNELTQHVPLASGSKIVACAVLQHKSIICLLARIDQSGSTNRSIVVFVRLNNGLVMPLRYIECVPLPNVKNIIMNDKLILCYGERHTTLPQPSPEWIAYDI